MATREKEKALKRLIDNKQKTALEQKERSKQAAFLLNKLKTSSSAKLKNALKIFETASKFSREHEQTKSKKLAEMYDKILQAFRVKKEGSLSALRARALRREQLLRSMLGRLAGNTRSLLKRTLDSMSRHSNRAHAISNAHKNLKRRVIGAIFRNKLGLALEKLMVHRLNSLLKDQRQLRTLQRLKLLSAFKKTNALVRLRSSTQIAALLRKIKLMVVSDLFKKLARTLKTGTLSKLRGHKKALSARRDLAVKTVRRNVNADIAAFYRRLKGHKKLIEHNKKHGTLSGLFFSMKKYQKFVKKMAFDRWSCKSFLLKVINLEGRLEGMKSRRKMAGFEAAKRAWGISKYKKFVESLHQFTATIDRLKKARKDAFFRQFEELFRNQNPWFKRTINIWVLMSKINHQSSFWRMRYGKQLSQDKVSPELSLKLKKLIFLLGKELQKNISFGFWKLNSAMVARSKNLASVYQPAPPERPDARRTREY